ncbi:uncharacterized protein C8Q71DRAFT_729761 [Rhodofomes roseus]|uniref:Uncharacterized protein n=1 Tax=Rhodofomes roseus TaxID=34475 RepID=A0ABQ8KXV3_9APHY|nr:uncharacterized protein C8Q71DRAFT_729761 [Rhodofomes roseus]KAH9843715.1 hypothetical protein C8Q71DRAFT_729761 [Rhodofomes roseus]
MSAFTSYYVPHVIYSLAITSLGMHLLSQRKTAEAERFQLAAQLSLLEPTAARLRSGERIPSQELDRITKLVRSHRAGTSEREEGSGEEISWREVMLGRKKDAREAVEEARRKRAEEWDRRDLEAVQKEVRSSGS